MAFIPPQGNQTVMVDNSNNIVYPASFQKVVATQATIAGNNFTSVPSVIDPENATTTQLPSVASVVNYVADVVEGGSSGLIPAIQSDIQTLEQVKSNRGEFWFNGGLLTTINRMPLNTPFSCVWTCSMTKAEFEKHITGSPAIIGNEAYFGSPTTYQGWTICRSPTYEGTYPNNILFGVSGIDTSNGYDYRNINILNYLDGNPHVWLVVYNGLSTSLYIDNNQISSITGTFNFAQSRRTFTIGGLGATNENGYYVWGKFSRIKYFNFDMSNANAPYTIADYIAGKDESPFLKLGSATTYNANANWLAFHNNEGTFASTGNDLTFTASEDATAGYLVFYVDANVKSGSKIDVSIDSFSTDSSATFTNWQGVAGNTSGLNASGKSANTSYGYSTSFTTTADATNIGFWLWKTGTFTTGETLTLVKPQIKVNGALLSLDEYSIKVGATQIVPDVSSNNNDATITGSVYGSKDTSIAKMAQLFYQSQQG